MVGILCHLDGVSPAPGPIRHTEAEWEQHKALLQHLYFAEKKTAKEVQQYMTKRCLFKASLQQYQRQFKKWGVEKNKPQERWTRLPGLLKRKRLDIDHAEIWDAGIMQDRKRVKKYLSRNNRPTFRHKYGVSNSLYTRCDNLTDEDVTVACPDDGIFVRVALTPRLELSSSTSLPWYDFIRSFRRRPYSGTVEGHTHLLSNRNEVVYDIAAPTELKTAQNPVEASLSTAQQHVKCPYTRGSESMAHLISILADALAPRPGHRQCRAPSKDFNVLFEAAMPAEIPWDIYVEPATLLRIATARIAAAGVACLFYIISNSLWDRHNAKSDLGAILEAPDILRFILKSPKPPAKALTQYLVRLAIDGRDLKLLRILQFHGVDFNRPLLDPSPVTPVQYLIYYGDVTAASERILKFLLKSGADPNCCWKHRTTQKPGQAACCRNLPIMQATSFYRSGTMTDMLVAANCTVPGNVDITGAICNGISTKTLKALLLHARLDFPWKSLVHRYLYPLQAAVGQCNEQMVAILLDYGVCPNGRADKQLVDHFRARFESRASWGADRYEMDESHIRAPLVSAILGRASGITEMLFDAGADVNQCHASALAPHFNPDSISCVDERNASTHVLVLTTIQAAVYVEDLQQVEMILSKWVPARSCHGTPPVVLAALSGNEALVKLLLRYELDINEVEDDDALHSTVRRRFSALGAAAAVGDIAMMSTLIEAGADVDQPASGPGMLSPLQSAVYFRQHRSIVMLLEAGADPSLPGAEEDGMAAIEAAVFIEDSWAFNFLCDHCVPTQAALTHAAALEDGRFFHRLIEMGCKVDDAEVLEASIFEGERFFQLMKAGLQLSTSFQRKTLADVAFTAAIKYDNVRVLRWVREHGHSVCAETIIASSGNIIDDPELFAVYAQFLERTERHFETGRDFPAIPFLLNAMPIEPDDLAEYRKVIHSAVQTFIVNGADINAEHRRKTSLQAATELSLNEVSQLLIEHGADVDQRPTKETRTALQSACWHGNIKIVSLLLKHGADVNAAAQDSYSEVLVGDQFVRHTTLQIACGKGHVEVACMLIQHGARINEPASDLDNGRTALQAACEAGHVEIVNLLINHRAEVNAPAGRRYGATALQAAAQQGFFRIVQILVAAGADLDAPASALGGRTAINGAAHRGRLDVLHYLLDHYEGDESISAICERARTHAWKEGHMGVVHLLDTYQRHPA